MKQKSKQNKIVSIFVLLTLFFLCAFNITYSYFTSSAQLTGSNDFYGFNVSFVYYVNNSPTTVSNASTLTLYPNTPTLLRGDYFGLQTASNGSPISNLSIVVQSGSCSCFARYWIDAYILNAGVADTTINYGQYFNCGYVDNGDFVAYTTSTSNAIDRVVNNGLATYYVYYAIGANSSADCFEAIQLSINAPSELLGNSLQLSITFEAVQSTNNAYEYVFNDSSSANYRGAYTGW